MRHEWFVPEVDEAALRQLAQSLALKLAPGDTLALSGGLGAGKTTFARHLIRALVGDPESDVPSPTFPIMVTYETPRLPVAHLDLYRITRPDEALELGAEETLASGALLIEWPNRAPHLLSDNTLEIRLEDGARPETRTVQLSGTGTWGPRLARVEEITAFLSAAGDWRNADIRYLQGDASVRAYARLKRGDTYAVLMDFARQPDGPPIRNGLPYSRIARLAEDVRPFVAIQGALKEAGVNVPALYAVDLERGLLLLEDFGDRVFGREVEAGASQLELWRDAVDVLLALRKVPAPERIALPDGSSFSLPTQDLNVLEIETELLLDWYIPHVTGTPASAADRSSFAAAWRPVLDRVLANAKGWVLRDFHSPNLMLLAGRPGPLRVGILDFQDALRGPAAYDLVSLLQDARVDVAEETERTLLDHYCLTAAARDKRFDEREFRFAYAALGAQRNTKILGIFARLADRDGKTAYLRHIPRIWRYLVRDLAHPELAGLAAWYDTRVPERARGRVLEVS